MDFTVVLAASAAVNRFTEAIKPIVRKWKISEAAQDGLLVFIALLAGVAVALMGNLSLFTGVESIPPFAGLLLTGAIVGLGADAIHIVLDFLYGWRDAVRPTEGVVMAIDGEPVTAKAEIKVG